MPRRTAGSADGRDLELLGEKPARRLRDAVDSTAASIGTATFTSTSPSRTARRQEIVGAVRASGQGAGRRRDPEEMIEAVTIEGIRRTYNLGQPDPDLVIRTSGSSVCPASCCGRAHIRRCGSPRRTGRRSGGSISRALRDFSRRHRRYGV